MGFKEKLKEKRLEANLSQAQLAKKVSVSTRTIQNYELGSRKPRNFEIVERIAAALNTSAESLLETQDMIIISAHEKGGTMAAREINDLVSEVTGLFAGGELSEESLDGAMKALSDAYWIAKEKNKKYAPKHKSQ